MIKVLTYLCKESAIPDTVACVEDVPWSIQDS